MATEKEMALKRFGLKEEEMQVTRITQCLHCIFNERGKRCEPWGEIPYYYQSNEGPCPYRQVDV